jgi:hypothetical protein
MVHNKRTRKSARKSGACRKPPTNNQKEIVAPLQDS